MTHARASCLSLASSALTSEGVLKSSALDQASVSWTSKAAWTCVTRLVWRRRRWRGVGRVLCVCRDGGARGAAAARFGVKVGERVSRERARRRRGARRAPPQRRHVLCVCRATAARGAVVVGPGRRDTYLLLHVRRDARACGARSEVLGLQCVGVGARARGGCPFLEERGARGGGASGRSYGSPPPMVVALRARKGCLCGVHS